MKSSKSATPTSARPTALTMPEITDGQVAGIAPGHCRQIGALNLDDRDVGLRIRGHNLAFELPAVGQDDFHVDGIRDHVIIRDDVATRRDDDAGALSILAPSRRFSE